MTLISLGSKSSRRLDMKSSRDVWRTSNSRVRQTRLDGGFNDSRVGWGEWLAKEWLGFVYLWAGNVQEVATECSVKGTAQMDIWRRKRTSFAILGININQQQYSRPTNTRRDDNFLQQISGITGHQIVKNQNAPRYKQQLNQMRKKWKEKNE